MPYILYVEYKDHTGHAKNFVSHLTAITIQPLELDTSKVCMEIINIYKIVYEI
jgi:hypothetical protein